MTDDHIDTEALRATYPLDSADQWEAEGRHSLAKQRRDFHRVLDALEAAQTIMTNEQVTPEWLRHEAEQAEFLGLRTAADRLERAADALEAVRAERDTWKWAAQKLSTAFVGSATLVKNPEADDE